MNAQNRRDLEKALELIEEGKSIIESIKDEEQEKFDNLSDGLQQSEKVERFEENVSNLESAITDLEGAIDYVNSSIE